MCITHICSWLACMMRKDVIWGIMITGSVMQWERISRYANRLAPVSCYLGNVVSIITQSIISFWWELFLTRSHVYKITAIDVYNIICFPGRCHHHHKIDSTWSEETQRKLDIVLVASLKRNWFSSNNSIGMVLSSVFSNVITGLRNEARLYNVRVGLLGYSGSGYLSEPHVYTVQG